MGDAFCKNPADRPVPWLVYVLGISTFPIAAAINSLASQRSQWIESVYSQRIYRPFAEHLPNLTAAFPFSLTEIALATLILGILIQTLRAIAHLLARQRSLSNILIHALGLSLSLGSLSLLAFLLIWGLNIHRLPVSTLLDLPSKKPSPEQVLGAAKWHLKQANLLRATLDFEAEEALRIENRNQRVFERSDLGYAALSERFPTFAGQYVAPKGMVFSTISAYLGIAGFFSPLTGEAHINIHSPAASLPFTVCHELAHQRGYVKEDEANFVGFLACENHPDVLFQYAAHFSALLYLSNAVRQGDAEASAALWKGADEGVLADVRSVVDYNAMYRGQVSQTFSKVHDASLKLQGQTAGVLSYSNVVSFLVAKWEVLPEEELKEAPKEAENTPLPEPIPPQ